MASPISVSSRQQEYGAVSNMGFVVLALAAAALSVSDLRAQGAPQGSQCVGTGIAR